MGRQSGDGGPALLALRVGPAVGAIDEAALRATLLKEMRRGNLMDGYQAELIRRTESVVVRRLPPIATRAGKVLPFHLARTSGAGGGT